MEITPEKLRSLIEAELSLLTDPRPASHIRELLIEPTLIYRNWDYGEPGQSFPCWLVLSHTKSNTGIAYCEFGFGPRTPWGLVFLSDGSIGMDSAWFDSFMDAYFESSAATDLSIWRVFKHEHSYVRGVALTEESDWDSTWDEVYRLRAEDPTYQYDCRHDIRFRLNDR